MSAAGLPRWLARALVIIGWLLTPLWAWGASFLGLWIGAHVSARFTSPLGILAPPLLGAVLFGFVTLWVWVWFMRRVPHLLSHHMADRPALEHPPVAEP